MGIFENIRSWILAPLLDDGQRERITVIERNRQYRRGDHPDTMKVKIGKADDNIVINFVGLVVSRSVSLLFGKGVEFDMPGDDNTAVQEYIDEMYSVNKANILLHKLAVSGAESGTAYLKIMPGWYDNYPRLSIVLPENVNIHTDPEDIDQITGYTIQYVIEGLDNKEKARKQEIMRNVSEDGTVTSWTISDYEKSDSTSWRWQLLNEEIWDYDFAPMIHCQNLPSVDSAYGEPDITSDIIRLQDRINFIAGDQSKIVRYHAHPKTIAAGVSSKELVEFGPDKVVYVPPTANLYNLEMQSDLSGTQNFLASLVKSLMDVTRTVDISSLPDRIGALTNFGLRVLYQDTLQKLATKRELYGELLVELNRRCLILAGLGDDGGMVVWPDPLPTNGTEETQSLQSDLDMKIVSRQTVSKQRGYDWDSEQERITEEATGEGDIGTRLLENFMTGRNA